jgi:hypothetical protein
MPGLRGAAMSGIPLRVRPAMLLIICAFLAGCASESAPVVAGPARYASPDEAARLHAQAAANFQRERERQGMVARRTEPSSQPRGTAAPVMVQASALPPVLEGPSEQPGPRRKVSAAEARYAMLIGKSPFDLTPGERAVAVGN